MERDISHSLVGFASFFRLIVIILIRFNLLIFMMNSILEYEIFPQFSRVKCVLTMFYFYII